MKTFTFSISIPGTYVSLCWEHLAPGGPEEGGWWRVCRSVESVVWVPIGLGRLARLLSRWYAERRNEKEGNRPMTETLSDGEWVCHVGPEPEQDEVWPRRYE